MIIDLGNGIKTNAQLTLPAIGKGPFPSVLLIPGSAAEDMNYTAGFIHVDKKTGQKIYPPTPFFQIAQYLSKEDLQYLDMTRGEQVQIIQFSTAMYGEI
jgi:uncharacterized protein